ncbi:hypothetical protein D3C84_1072510 [compost metagenome]
MPAEAVGEKRAPGPVVHFTARQRRACRVFSVITGGQVTLVTALGTGILAIGIAVPVTQIGLETA